MFTGQEHVLDFLLSRCMSSNSEDCSKVLFGNWKPWRVMQGVRECCLTAESLSEVFSILQWNNTIFFQGPQTTIFKFQGDGKVILFLLLGLIQRQKKCNMEIHFLI